MSPRGGIIISTETAGTCHGTPEASHGRRANLRPEMIHEVLKVMTALAKEGVR